MQLTDIPYGNKERMCFLMPPPMKGCTLEACDWEITVIGGGGSIKVPKQKAVRVSENRCDFVVDTTLIGKGKVSFTIEITLKDPDFGDRPQTFDKETVYTVK